MRGNITRRGKSSWRLKFDVDADNGERRIRYVTVKGKRADAEAELVRLLNDAHKGTLVDPTKVTVGDYLRSWLDGKSDITDVTRGEIHGDHREQNRSGARRDRVAEAQAEARSGLVERSQQERRASVWAGSICSHRPPLLSGSVGRSQAGGQARASLPQRGRRSYAATAESR